MPCASRQGHLPGGRGDVGPPVRQAFVVGRGVGPSCDNHLVTHEALVERIEVQRLIPASPADIFDVLTDPRGHVAIDSSGMLMAASGERIHAVGDSFVVHMDREVLNDLPLGLYDVAVVIVKLDPEREIAWTVEGGLKLGHLYGYRLASVRGHSRDLVLDWFLSTRSGRKRASSPSSPSRRCGPPWASWRERSRPAAFDRCESELAPGGGW